MAHLTHFSFEFSYKIFTEDAALPHLYHGAKKSKMTKNSNQGGPALNYFAPRVILHCIPLAKILAQTAIVSQLIKNNVSERFEGMTFRLIDPQVM